MIGAIRTRTREAFTAFASNARSRNLRRAQLSFGAAWAAEWAFTVGLSIVAFRDGGAAAVGLVAMLRLAPSAVTGPFLGALADRFARDRIIAWIGIVRTLAIGGCSVIVASGGATAIVYGLAVIATIAVTPLRAAHSALLPSLCRSPDELTGAMVTRGLLDSLSVLLGPLAASGLLIVGGPEAVLVGVAALSLWSALLAVSLDYEAPPQVGTSVGAAGVRAQIGEGMRAITGAGDVALMASLFWAQTFTRGCLTVFSVVVAVDLLALGESGVGVLNAAVGAGAVLGSLGAALLVGSRRLGAWLVLAVALWGIPFVLIGAFPSEAAALALLALVGVANAIEDVAFFTLFGRTIPDELLGRVFGVIESGVAISVGIGALVTPLIIDLVGLRPALAVLGAVCPTLAVLALARLRSLDRTLEVRPGRRARRRRTAPHARSRGLVRGDRVDPRHTTHRHGAGAHDARGVKHPRGIAGAPDSSVWVLGGASPGFAGIEHWSNPTVGTPTLLERVPIPGGLRAISVAPNGDVWVSRQDGLLRIGAGGCVIPPDQTGRGTCGPPRVSTTAPPDQRVLATGQLLVRLGCSENCRVLADTTLTVPGSARTFRQKRVAIDIAPRRHVSLRVRFSAAAVAAMRAGDGTWTRSTRRVRLLVG